MATQHQRQADRQMLSSGQRAQLQRASAMPERRGTVRPTLMGWLFEGLGTSATGPALWMPTIEVLRRQHELVVRAELAGLEPEDINVTVEDGQLTIWGERQQEQAEQNDGFVRSERSYGAFYRTLPLPDGADADHITATFRNGVLEVTVPVSAPKERERKIPVQAADTGQKPENAERQQSDAGSKQDEAANKQGGAAAKR
jgi:HSP20 family protein